MTTPKPPAARPCGSRPYRTDVPSGIWHPDEYDRLPAYDNDTAHQPMALFMCHQVDGRLCAGWVGCHDMDNSLAVLVAAMTGTLPDDTVQAVLDYTTPTSLFPTGQAAADHGRADVDHPSPAAVRAITKITTRRGGTP